MFLLSAMQAGQKLSSQSRVTKTDLCLTRNTQKKRDRVHKPEQWDSLGDELLGKKVVDGHGERVGQQTEVAQEHSAVVC